MSVPAAARERKLLHAAHKAEQHLASISRDRRPTDEAVSKAAFELRDTYHRLILEHYELACRKGVERRT